MDLLRDLYARFRVLIHEVAKFGIVGILAFLITIVGANALRSGAGLGPLTSVTIATVVATVFAFLGNKLWAFRHRKGSHLGRESVLFFVFNGIGLLIQLAFVAAVALRARPDRHVLLQRGEHHRHRRGHHLPAVLLPPLGVPDGRATRRRRSSCEPEILRPL